jgi:hypothetical protein
MTDLRIYLNFSHYVQVSNTNFANRFSQLRSMLAPTNHQQQPVMPIFHEEYIPAVVAPPLVPAAPRKLAAGRRRFVSAKRPRTPHYSSKKPFNAPAEQSKRFKSQEQTTAASFEPIHTIYDEPAIKKDLVKLDAAIAAASRAIYAIRPYLEHEIMERVRVELCHAIGKAARSVRQVMSFTVGHSPMEFADRYEDMCRDTRLLLEKLSVFFRVRNGFYQKQAFVTLSKMLTEGAGTSARRTIQEIRESGQRSPATDALVDCLEMLYDVLGSGNKVGFFCVHNAGQKMDSATRSEFFEKIAKTIHRAENVL